MISEVVMPQMGADMKEGTILRWLKAEGDPVQRGEPIAEIETDKANVEIEAFASGIMRRRLHAEGETVEVGKVIAVIAAPDEDISQYGAGDAAEIREQQATAPAPSPAMPAPSAATAAGVPPEAVGTTATQPPAEEDEASADKVRASPVARRLAEELGIDLARLRGSGPDGRILRRDVEAAHAIAAAAPAAALPEPQAAPEREPEAEGVAAAAVPAEITELPLSRMRQTIARRMQQSKQEAPHYYLSVDIDMTEALRFLAEAETALRPETPLTINDVVLLATSRTLVRHPRFNAWWADGRLQLHRGVHLGMAVSLEEGLLVATIRDCERKGLAEISREARDLAQRARAGHLRPEEYSGSTFTVSNAGMFGVGVLVAIINPPQVGILGVGAAQEKPVVRQGQVVVRTMMTVTLSADHRATDGADGARFLRTLRESLERPELMLL